MSSPFQYQRSKLRSLKVLAIGPHVRQAMLLQCGDISDRTCCSDAALLHQIGLTLGVGAHKP